MTVTEFIASDYTGIKDGYSFSYWLFDGVVYYPGDKMAMGNHDILLVALWESDKSSGIDQSLFIIIGSVEVVFVALLAVLLLRKRL